MLLPLNAVWLGVVLWIPITIGLLNKISPRKRGFFVVVLMYNTFVIILFRRYGIFFVLAVITVLLFSPVFLKGMVPISTDYMLAWYEPWKTAYSVNGVPAIPHKPVVDDAFRHLYPLRVIASQILRQGSIPLWNPYNAAGTPLFAIMHPGYLTPFGIFFLIITPAAAWTLYVMMQPVVLGLATYWYAKKLRLSAYALVFASTVVVLSGFTVVRLEYGEFLYVLAGLPLLLGIVEELTGAYKRRMVLAVPWAVMGIMLSGQPHMIIYTLGIFALYTFVRLPFIDALRVGGFAILGIGLSGVQLLPGLELYMQSTIDRTTSAFIFERFLLPVTHLITVIIPNYFGNQATYNYFGPHDYTETVAYVGFLPVFFAVLANRYIRTPVVTFFSAVVVVSVLMTVDWFGTRFFFSLPIPVLSSDVPSRVFVLTTFAITILAAVGISAWETLPWKKKRSWLFWSGLVLGTILLGTGIVYRLHIACPPELSGCRMVSLRTTLIEVIGFAAFITSGLFGFRMKGNLRAMILSVPLVIVLVLGTYNARKFLPFSPVSRVFPDTPVLSAVMNSAGYNRFFGFDGADFRTNLTAYYRLYSLQYFDPLHVRRYAEIVSFVNTGDRKKDIRRSDINIISDATVSAQLSARRERMLDMTGTTVLIRRKSDRLIPGVPVMWEDGTWQITKRPTALPRAYLITDVRTQPDPDMLLAQLFSGGTDIGKTAFVETPVSGVDIGANTTGSVAIDSYEANVVTMSVTSESDALLVLSDAYYPGWRASVDGGEAIIYRTNFTFRGIAVPKGAHQVRFYYDPDSIKLGIAISVISVFLWGGIGLFLMRKKIRKHH